MKIIVVGAGIVGCAVAHELAVRGASVHVIDPRGPAGGATHASAGVLAPYIEGHFAALRDLGVSSLALYDAFIQRVRADARCPVEYQRSGSLQVAFNTSEQDGLTLLARQLAGDGVEHMHVDGPGARRLEPRLSDRVTAALLIPVHGYVAARALTTALADAAKARGATFSAARVTGLDAALDAKASTKNNTKNNTKNDTVRLELSHTSADDRFTRETIAADAVIIAAGSWSSAVAAPALMPSAVKPIRGQLLQLALPGRAASRVVWGQRCYLVPWDDGTVLAGATVEDVGFDETTTVAGVRALVDAASELLPALEHASFQQVRAGLRPQTVDELPVIGPSSTMRRVFYATGHYRSGVLLAPLTAKLVADLVFEQREGDELALTRPARVGL